MTKVLLIDAGNTRVKWRLADTSSSLGLSAPKLEHNHVPTDQLKDDDFFANWAANLKSYLASHQLEKVVLSSVLGQQWLRQLTTALSPMPIVCPQKNQSQVLFTQYDPVEQLGLDRWFSSLAVGHITQAELNLVVSLGTATTVDAVVRSTLLPGKQSTPFVHLGGVIAPGVHTMFASLHQSTAQLPLSQLNNHTWPTNTLQAIGAGVFSAQAELLKAKAIDLQMQFDNKPCRVWLTGGHASDLVAHLPFQASVRSELVFEGLMCAYKESP